MGQGLDAWVLEALSWAHAKGCWGLVETAKSPYEPYGQRVWGVLPTTPLGGAFAAC